MKIVALAIALLVANLSAPVFAQESTREDFQDFCRAWEGRWVGNVTWVADLPGFGKKAEQVTAYADCTVAEDGNAMICRYYGGDGSATWIVVYDAGDKQIKSLWVTSGGILAHDTLYKKGDKWIVRGHGSHPDGTKTEATQTVTITDSGNTHTWKGSVTIGGKKADEVHDVWRRVSK
jgi:hypothetical protein